MCASLILPTTFFYSPNSASCDEVTLELAMRQFRMAEHAGPGTPLRIASYMDAERMAEELVARDPTEAQAHFLLFAARGRRLVEESGRPTIGNFWKFAGLGKHLKRTLELDPRHANALAAKGGMLLDLPGFLGGDVEAARGYLEDALELNPTGPGTRLTLARALARQGLDGPAREQALLAAHYACLRRRQSTLREAEQLLATLGSGAL
jgi:tetratricopeptide (TPR) repeat protein